MSSSSAPSRLHPLRLPVFILSAFPSSSSAAFLSPSSAPSRLHPQRLPVFILCRLSRLRPQLPSRLSASILSRLPVFVLCCLFRLVLCAFPSSSSAPSRLYPLRLPVSILCAFPSPSSAAFHIPNPPISLSTHLTPSPLRPLSPRIHHLTNHPLARAKTSGLTTLCGENAVSPYRKPPD